MHSFFDATGITIWPYVALYTAAAFFVAGLIFAIIVRFGFELQEHQELELFGLGEPELMTLDDLIDPPTSPIDLPPMLDNTQNPTIREIE